MIINTRLMAWWVVVAALAVTIVYWRPKKSVTQTHFSNIADSKCSLDQGEKKNNAELYILCLWLEENHMFNHFNKIQAHGVHSLQDFYKIQDEELKLMLGVDRHHLFHVLNLPSEPEALEGLKNQVFNHLSDTENKETSVPRTWLGEIMSIILLWCAALGVGTIYMALLRALEGRSLAETVTWLSNADFKRTLAEWFSSQKALATNAKVSFQWKEPCVVGCTVSFTVEFFQRWNHQPYPISDADNVKVSIRQGSSSMAADVKISGSSPNETNQAKVTFTVRKAGQYHIDVYLGHFLVHGSPFIKTFLAGPPDASKSSLVRPTSMVVCTAGKPHQLAVDFRDEYGNPCSLSNDSPEQCKALELFSLEAYQVGSSIPCHPVVQSFWIELLHRMVVNVTFNEEGIYQVCLKYRGIVINKAEFNIIALSRTEAAQVEKALANRSLSYEAKLLSVNNEKFTKSKKVFCFLSPKQLALKDYFLGFIPKRVVTFRLCPATRFHFQGSNNMYELPVLKIEDGAQQKVEIASKDAHLVAASFAHYLMKNIGGSETFADKQHFFYQEIRRHHQKKNHDKICLHIQREQILLSSLKATRNFSANDWCKNFEITFAGEEGLDWGGLRREWIELLCVNIFGKKENGMFKSFSDGAQALVHPNPKIPNNCKVKHYEFAGRIVGKCLYETSLGATYRQLVKARFTRSFLAQLIGLRINYRYFEHDDPQLFLSKIKYIEENDVTDMELTFSEEEYGDGGQLVRTIELIPGGSRIQVDNTNKYQYLDALAQHRLVNSVKEQVDAFIRGLTELVPDNLLSIFDENELELLLCGTSEYSVADLKANHALVGSSPEFKKVVSWFWTAITNFGSEELSRLLQFTTGSSQLPPGGLSELSPRFQITAAPSFGTLPTAHTCFNQLCLPDYESYEQFEKSLLLAINEGSEGFGLV